jgi:hypothetical protein
MFVSDIKLSDANRKIYIGIYSQVSNQVWTQIWNKFSHNFFANQIISCLYNVLKESTKSQNE